MSDLYSLLDKFPTTYFITKAIPIINIDLISVELLNKHTEND